MSFRSAIGSLTSATRKPSCEVKAPNTAVFACSRRSLPSVWDLIHENLPDWEQESANACVVLYKKFKAPAENAQEKQKQLRFLLYRGFDIDTAMQALRSEWPD